MTVHEAPVGGSVEWFTPPSLFKQLGATFDLDPAASFRAAWVPALQFICKEEDGLSGPWGGHVWLNPPYGPAGVRFIDRMIEHGDGLLLLPSRTETRAYQRALAAADMVCLLRERLWFVRGDGTTGRSSFGSTLFAFGEWAFWVLIKADLGWCGW
jgi:DNA N-6-adenine-methyltransferase Dam